MGAEEDKTRLPVVDEETPEDAERRQRPLETHRHNYYEPGKLAVGFASDGMPQILGDLPTGLEKGLEDDNLVCTRAPGREACRFYAALLRPAEGEARGFERMKEIRRFCTRLATSTELFEIDGEVLACTLREPRDSRSAELIFEFEEKQKRQARDAAETSGTLSF